MKVLLVLALLSILSVVNGQIFGKCFTPDQYRGDCVYFKTCPSLLQLYNNRATSDVKDRLFLSLSQCGFRDGQPLVCCRDTVRSTVEPVTEPPKVPRSSLLPKPGVCGTDSIDSIYGGEVTNLDEYPWMALLAYSKPKNRTGLHCGGVLISSRYVLSASHCVNGKDLPPSWKLSGVRLGESDTSTTVDCDDSYVRGKICNTIPALDIPIELKIPHENYNPEASSQHNDIALLRLARTVTFNQYVRPICLPMASDLQSMDFVNNTMSVAGWGKTEKVSASKVKLKVNVDGITNDECQQVYLEESRAIIDSQLCAGGKKGVDSCRGDSGGPLMRQTEEGESSYWYLTGLVSFGPSPCGMEGWPGVYTRITKYVSWIESKLQP